MGGGNLITGHLNNNIVCCNDKDQFYFLQILCILKHCFLCNKVVEMSILRHVLILNIDPFLHQ